MELRPLEPSVEDSARELYLSSFPEAERIPFDDLLRMRDPGHSFLWLEDEGSLLGIAYVVESDDLVFLLYLAVDPEWRGCGLGSDIIWMVKCRCNGRRLFLNIEPTDEEADNIAQRLRRLNFYHRNGFVEEGTYDVTGGMRYLLMSWGGTVTPEDAERFFSAYMVPAHGDERYDR